MNLEKPVERRSPKSGMREETCLQDPQHRVQLVLPESDVIGDLPHGVNGLQPHLFDLVVEHVDQKVKALLREGRRRLGQHAEGLDRSYPNL